MRVTLEKSSGRSKCRHPKCRKLLEFITDDKIKANTTCAAIVFKSAFGECTAFYCRDCIDFVYNDIKSVLNSNLWAFH